MPRQSKLSEHHRYGVQLENSNQVYGALVAILLLTS